MCNHTKQVSGFTLLQLMAAIAIAGILMAAAVPTFRDMLRRTRLTTYANEFVTALNIARSEAIKQGITVTVRKIGGTGTYWNTSGWNVFVDTNANGILDTSEKILRTYNALPNVYTLTGSTTGSFDTFIRYQSDGTRYLPSGSTNNDSFTICDNSDNNNTIEPYTAKVIIISLTGRIQMARDRDGNGIPENNSTTPVTYTSCGL